MNGLSRIIWFKPSASAVKKQQFLHLMRLFKQLQINFVFDVGANQGQFGKFLRKAGYYGQIISFEPSSEDYNILVGYVNSDPHWQTKQLALGEKNGQLSLNIFKCTVFNSPLEPNDYHVVIGGRVDNVEQVPVARLDDIFDELITSVSDPRVFLKIDTQGYDHAVLSGATKSLQRILALQTEVSVHSLYRNTPNFIETIYYLSDLGFEITGLFPAVREAHMRVIEFDCVMLNSSVVGELGPLQEPYEDRRINIIDNIMNSVKYHYIFINPLQTKTAILIFALFPIVFLVYIIFRALEYRSSDINCTNMHHFRKNFFNNFHLILNWVH